MSSLPDRSDSPRWPAEPQPSGIVWGEVIVLALSVATVPVCGAVILWWMGVI
jgi:hypothetical protein